MMRYNDLLISNDFFPKIGGAHHWLYEVYSRWPTSITALTQDYSNSPKWADAQKIFDVSNHGALTIKRHEYTIRNWGLLCLGGIRCWCQIQKAIRENKTSIDRIHFVKALPEAAFAILHPSYKAKTIIYAHGEEFLVAKSSKELFWLTRFALNRADLIIANSRSTVALLREFSPNVPVSVIHPGVAVEKFRQAETNRQIMREKWLVNDATVVLLTMARHEERKNQLGVLQAIRDLNFQKQDILYVVGSDGPERKNLQQFVFDNDLQEIVLFTGYLSDQKRRDCFAAADIHIMPSVQRGPMIEGFGIVFMEAAAVGIPSISGNVGGQSEAVINDKTGIVVDGDSQEELKAAIKILVKNADLRKKMGDEARLWAAENDWDRIAKKTYDLVMSLN
jgi:phosphatidylinositol alpha-1,6-mannosyltransferase